MSAQCPKCSAAVEDTAEFAPSRGQAVKAILTDWRVWAFALGLNLGIGMLTAATGLPSSYNAGGGAAVGLFVVFRIGKLRKCAKCGAVAVPAST